jgi:hypothetical protein
MSETRIIGGKNRDIQNRMGAIKNSMKITKIIPSEENELKDKSGGWQDWDTDNNFPYTYWTKLSKCGLPQRIISDLCRIHYGHGLYFYKEKIENNKIVRIPVIDARIQEWMQKNLIGIQWGNVLIRDLYLWNMSGIEFTIDQANKKIIKVKVHDASLIRWGDKNEAGIIDKAYLSANWPSPAKDKVKELTALDPLDPEGSLDKNPRETNFIYPVVILTPLKMYYPEPAWAADDMIKWLTVSLMTPEFHQSLLENILVTPTVIYINEDFWSQRYTDWAEKKNEQQARKKETFDAIEASLSGSAKAGKFITSGFAYDDNGKEIKGIMFEPLKMEIPDKAFLMSNAQADSEFHYTLGGDPSLSGHGMPGGKELSGSGSEKMRSLQNRQILASLDRAVTLQFLNFVARYHGWDGEFGYLDIQPTTLDENKDGLTPGKTEENVN